MRPVDATLNDACRIAVNIGVADLSVTHEPQKERQAPGAIRGFFHLIALAVVVILIIAARVVHLLP
jgi:hypothetical protein